VAVAAFSPAQVFAGTALYTGTLCSNSISASRMGAMLLSVVSTSANIGPPRRLCSSVPYAGDVRFFPASVTEVPRRSLLTHAASAVRPAFGAIFLRETREVRRALVKD